MTSSVVPAREPGWSDIPGASAGPASNYVPAPVGRTLAQQGLPQGDTPVQHAQLAHGNTRRQYEAWRSTVPAHLLSQHARDFMSTPAFAEHTQAADAVAARDIAAQAAHDRARGGLSTPLEPAAQTRADRWWSAQLPVLEKSTAGGVAAAISNLAKGAEPWQLAVIAEMAGPLLAAKGISPDTLDAILEQNSAKLKTAGAVRQKAAQANAVVQANRNSLEKSIRLGTISSNPVDASRFDPDVVA